MCHDKPHYAPLTRRAVKGCVNEQLQGNHRRISFSLWILSLKCSKQRLSRLSLSDRKKVANLIWSGWRKQPVQISLSETHRLVKALGGTLHMVAVPSCDVAPKKEALERKCQGKKAQTAYFINELLSHNVERAPLLSASKHELLSQVYSKIAKLTGLQQVTVERATVGAHEPRVRTTALIVAAMGHRLFLKVRTDGVVIDERHMPGEHAAYRRCMEAWRGRPPLWF